MKAYLLGKSGPPESLKISEINEPSPGPDEVKIKVRSIGINYAELLSRRGQYRWAPPRPYVPGMETYGEIVEVGESVTSHKVGDQVITGSQSGGYAEYNCVPQHLAFEAPAGFSPEECAAFLVHYMTAWVALRRLARIEKGEKVLIHAAAGGVGTAAIQLARAIGAEVIGTASKDEKLKLIRDLGASRAINYSTEDFLEVIKKEFGGVDVVLEVVGGEVYKKSLKALNTFGRLIVVGFASISINKWNPYSWWTTWRDAPKVDVMNMAINSFYVGATHIGYLTDNREIAMNEWKSLIEFCQLHSIRPVVGRIYTFDQMPEAHAWIESRHSTGKIVVKL